MKTNLKLLAISALFVWGSEAGHAGPVGPLTTFTAGTQAKASEVNANFNAVSAAVDDNAGRITTLETGLNSVNAAVTTVNTTVNAVSATVNAVNTTVNNSAARITVLEMSAPSPSITGNITLVPSTATAGNILKDTAPFIHNFGLENTFLGVGAGNFTMTGGFNAAVGQNALQNNDSGDSNTALGGRALENNTGGVSNTASGFHALGSNTTGSNNTASGAAALFSNVTGAFNVGVGDGALSRSLGNSNTGVGSKTMVNTTTGGSNTAVGANALGRNSTGSGNIAVGDHAGFNLTTGSNNIDIGHQGVAAEANTLRIGTAGTQTAAFVAGIRGATTGNGDAIAVVVDSAGQLGTVSSSRRVKDDIADMGGASGVLMKLRPVTFRYKTDRNPGGRTLQYGLVAEEVQVVAPGLVARSGDGKIETVYYQFLAPMLLNEYQKQQRTIQAQTARLAELERDRREQTARIEALEKQAAELAELRQTVARMAELLGRPEQERVAAR